MSFVDNAIRFQKNARTKEWAILMFEGSCDRCCYSGRHIDCRNCAIAGAHKNIMKEKFGVVVA